MCEEQLELIDEPRVISLAAWTVANWSRLPRIDVRRGLESRMLKRRRFHLVLGR
jgi:hypothetical protein